MPEIHLTMTPQLSLISEFILQPSTDLQSSYTSVTSMLPIANPMTSSLVPTPEASTIVQVSTASLTSEGLAPSMQQVTLQPSILISTVVTRSKSPNLLLSSEFPTLSILLRTSVLGESSLPLELFPSLYLPESQPIATSTIPQISPREMDVTITSSDIIELNASPLPSEVTFSVSQLLATQSLLLFPEVVTESSMTPELVSPIPTPFAPLPLLTLLRVTAL